MVSSDAHVVVSSSRLRKNFDFDLLVLRRLGLSSSSVVVCYRCILCRIIEMRQERAGQRIFPFPTYSPPDCLLNRHQFLVSQFLADTRRTRRPMLRGVARRLQRLARWVLGRVRKGQ